MITSMAAVGRARGWPLRRSSTLALVLALLATAGAAWAAFSLVHDQEHRLLKERASEIELVLTSAIDAIPAGLSAQGGILRATGGAVPAYERAAQEVVDAGPGEFTFAWLRPTTDGTGFTVVGAAGNGLHRGEVITDARAGAMTRAMHTDKM